MKKISYLLFLALNLVFFIDSYAQKAFSVRSDFDLNQVPPAPDYARIQNWAAHPEAKDMADSLPARSKLKDMQSTARADVFFIHPTVFTYQPVNGFEWNADVEDTTLNRKVDLSAILNQASVFNGSCKVYAPRYRQAHYSAFTTARKEDAGHALDLAYEDVRSAFEYYLKNYNLNRPVIIASHSQGTVHAKRLLKDFFDGKPLQKQLVEAYLIGIDTSPAEFTHIPPSDSASHYGGFVSWNTFLRNYYPPYYESGLKNALCTNPLTWRNDDVYASKKHNKGGVGLKFDMINQLADAQVSGGILWIHQPYVKGRIFLKIKVWHRADYNLFWMSIRDNVALRIEKFLENY